MRLFRSITLMLVLLTAVPVTVVGLILIGSTVDIVKTLTWELQQERAARASREASAYFDNLIDDLDLLISHLDVAEMNIAEQQKLLGFILQKRPEVNVIGFYDRYGRPLRNLQAFDVSRILPSELARHQQAVDAIDRGQVDVQTLAFSEAYEIRRPARLELEIPARQEPVVAVLIRIQAGGVTYLGMELSLTPLKRLVDWLRSSQRGQLLLVDRNWRQIAHSAGAEGSPSSRGEQAAQFSRVLGVLSAGAAHRCGCPAPGRFGCRAAARCWWPTLPWCAPTGGCCRSSPWTTPTWLRAGCSGRSSGWWASACWWPSAWACCSSSA